MNEKNKISKILSENDTGETGSHQAGILIPKNPPQILHYFPKLNINQKNPRAMINFTDMFGKKWKFNFIYYNNKFWGGTRNEYRLTGLTSFFREYNLVSGDKITFIKDENEYYIVSFEKTLEAKPKQVEDNQRIKLSNKWRVVPLV